MSDVVSQLEAVLAGIEERIPHTDKCCESVTDGAIKCDSCYCDRAARVRSEIARTVERIGDELVVQRAWGASRKEAWETALRTAAQTANRGGAAAFRATQEQETEK